jgi:hypothetical protein
VFAAVILAPLVAVVSGVHPGGAAFGDVSGDAIVAGVYVDDTDVVTTCEWSPAFPRDAHGTSADEVVRQIGSRTYVLYECDCDGDVTLHWIPEVDDDELADRAGFRPRSSQWHHLPTPASCTRRRGSGCHPAGGLPCRSRR